MAAPDTRAQHVRFRVLLMWTLTLLLLAAYVWLPDRESSALEADEANVAPDAHTLEIDSVAPVDPYPGSSVVVRYSGAEDAARIHVYAGKTELAVVARHAGAIVAELPRDTAAGDLKIRLAVAEDLGGAVAPAKRGKAYHVHVKAIRWRKAFRNAVGGFALIVLGIGLVTRAARAAIGFDGARRLARVTRYGVGALAAGALVGGATQSTTAAAGALAGMVSSNMLAISAAALAFIGAQIGAVAALFAFAGFIESHDALILVALGVLWSALARNRRGGAAAQLVLGAGIIAYGTQVLRPGLEPLALHPMLLSLGDGLRADSAAGTMRCVVLGAGLVAVLQGPAPVIVLLLDVAQTTGRFDLRTAVALLAGSSFGAAASALLITPGGPRCRELARLNLVLGAAGSVFAATTAGAVSTIAQHIVGDVQGAATSSQVSPQLAGMSIAFLTSQVVWALVSVPLVSWLVRALGRDAGIDAPVSNDSRALRETLATTFNAQRAALAAGFELACSGAREAGVLAEHRLADARAAIELLLQSSSGTAPALRGGASMPHASLESEKFERIGLSGLQIQRSFEHLLLEVEQLIDSRVGDDEPRATVAGDTALLAEMHGLLDASLELVASSLTSGTAFDLEAARDREIRMNGVEARARSEQCQRRVLNVVDAYEAAGNQVYRLAELVGEVPALDGIPSTPSPNP